MIYTFTFRSLCWSSSRDSLCRATARKSQRRRTTPRRRPDADTALLHSAMQRNAATRQDKTRQDNATPRQDKTRQDNGCSICMSQGWRARVLQLQRVCMYDGSTLARLTGYITHTLWITSARCSLLHVCTPQPLRNFRSPCCSRPPCCCCCATAAAATSSTYVTRPSSSSRQRIIRPADSFHLLQ